MSGGGGSTASGTDATVSGGWENTASGTDATVGGGKWNTASGSWATVGGGISNKASGEAATVAGGWGNAARGYDATVGGGGFNIASGWAATVPGGRSNTAAGDYSFAAGEGATAYHAATFVWDGHTGSPLPSYLSSSGDGQFIARAPGGFWFGDTTGDTTPTIEWYEFITTSTGAYLDIAGFWADISDRNLKENFTPVDRQAVLEQVAQLPITTWNYKAGDPSVRHLGPTAQDFYAAFGLGADDKHIAALDSSGVALAAIQALYERNQALEAENADLRDQMNGLRAENADLRARLDRLESHMTALEQAPPTASQRQRQASLPFLSWLGGLLVIGGLVLWQGRGGRK